MNESVTPFNDYFKKQESEIPKKFSIAIEIDELQNTLAYQISINYLEDLKNKAQLVVPKVVNHLASLEEKDSKLNDLMDEFNKVCGECAFVMSQYSHCDLINHNEVVSEWEKTKIRLLEQCMGTRFENLIFLFESGLKSFDILESILKKDVFVNHFFRDSTSENSIYGLNTIISGNFGENICIYGVEDALHAANKIQKNNFFDENATVMIEGSSEDNENLVPHYSVKYHMDSNFLLEEIRGELEYNQEKYLFFIQK